MSFLWMNSDYPLFAFVLIIVHRPALETQHIAMPNFDEQTGVLCGQQLFELRHAPYSASAPCAGG